MILNLDLLTYAGNLENLKEAENDHRYRFIRGDVRDAALVDRIFQEYDIDTVVHFAAESHVDRSIVDPQIFLTTNILGTQTLLDAAKKHWSLRPDGQALPGVQAGCEVPAGFHRRGLWRAGKDGNVHRNHAPFSQQPYSASKASADLFVRAYHETFGLPVNITRCSNNYGPYQFPEKLIPLMIHNAQQNKPLPVYGDGMQVRDWLHVSDHCSAIYTVLQKGKDGEIYNIGGNNEKANIDIVSLILAELDRPESLIQHVADRPGHDRRYAIDNTKITTQLG